MSESTSLKLLDILDTLRKKVEEDIAEEKSKKFVFDEDVEIRYSQELYGKICIIEDKLHEYGYRVEVIENLDIVDVSKKSKFIIRISSLDNCFVEIDIFDYRNVMLTYGVSEELYIEEKLVAISGIGQHNLQKVSKLVCEYLSYACFFKELQIKRFSKIGWSTYEGKRVFLYDKIYTGISSEETLTMRSENTDSFSENYGWYLDKKIDKLANTEKAIAEMAVILFKADWMSDFYEVLTYVNKEYNERKPYNSLILAAACSGIIRPLVPFSKENNINMNIVGSRAIGKSSLCHYALSIFGKSEQLEGSFLDSEEAIEIIRAKRPVLPYILDERMLRVEDESDKAKKKKILMDVFREYEGKVKERMAGAGKDLSGERTYGPIISSSVEPMLDLLLQTNKDLGQYRRFIEITIGKDDITAGAGFADWIDEIASDKYGYGVQMIVTYILEERPDIKEEYDRIKEIVSSELKTRGQEENKRGKTAVSGLESSASRFTLILTTLGIMQDALKYHLLKCMEVIKDSGGKENIETLEKYKNIVLCDLFYQKDSSDREAITPNQKDVLKLLIDNLVEKMSRVNIKIDVYENIMRFISENTELFEANPTNYGKNTDKYIGFKEEINGGKDIKIGFRKDRGLEWIIAYLYKNMSKEEIIDYIKGVSGTGTGYKDKMREVLGELAGRSLESVITSEDLGKIKIEYTNKISGIKNGVIITITKKVADLEEGKA